MAIFLIFIFVLNNIVGHGQPTIFEEYPATCSIKSQKFGAVMFTRKIQYTSTNTVEAFFNLCDNIPERYCGKNVMACIKKINTESVLISASQVYRGEEENLLLTNAHSLLLCERPRLVLRLFCSDDIKEPRLIQNNDCDYEIHILSPKCILPCTTWIYGQLKDFKVLRGRYRVKSTHRNFSLSICQANDDCNNGQGGIENIAVCDISEGTIPISTQESEHIEYYEDRNEIRIHGSYKQETPKKPTKLEIIMKCDWSKLSPEILYIEPQHQGKKYTFEILTFHGCIKIPLPCQFKINNLFYNFEALLKHGYSSVSLSSQRRLLLNVCQPLIMSNNNKNHCSDTSAQVCEINEDKVVNRGSIPTNFDVVDDALTTVFISGDTCDIDSSKKYKTTIKFICGPDSKPQLVSDIKNCEIMLKWITAVACPSYDIQPNCVSHPLPSNCTFELNNYFYNFNSLSLNNGSYIIKDESNSSLEYHLNICKPVMQNPCKKDVMAVVNNIKELDIRKKEISLGKFNTAYYRNNTVILEATSGAICKSMTRDYKSLIYFECADNNEHPKLKTKTECTFEFIWKTKAACPSSILKKMESPPCNFKHPQDNNKQIDLLKLKNKTLKLEHDGLIYVFNICEQEVKCDKTGKCYFASAANYIVENDEAHLEYTLSKICKSEEDFNKAMIWLNCDPITGINDDHYKVRSISSCVITIDLWTNLVCSSKDFILHNDIPKKIKKIKNIENIPDKANVSQNKIIDSKETNVPTKPIVILNCSIINPYTNYQFNISELWLQILPSQCPTYKFNYVANSIELIYTSHVNCQLDSGQFNSYTVTMMCSNSSRNYLPIIKKNTSCQIEYEYESLEVCKLSEKIIGNSLSASSGFSTGTILGISFGLLLLTSTLGVIGFIKCRKYKHKSLYHNLQELKRNSIINLVYLFMLVILIIKKKHHEA